jgi:hypothetical protein
MYMHVCNHVADPCIRAERMEKECVEPGRSGLDIEEPRRP